jgi:hypothetical protein
MIVRLELQADVHARLCAEAERRQQTLDQLITEFADTLPQPTPIGASTRLSFIGIGYSGRTDLGRRHREIRKAQADPTGRLDRKRSHEQQPKVNSGIIQS